MTLDLQRHLELAKLAEACRLAGLQESIDERRTQEGFLQAVQALQQVISRLHIPEAAWIGMNKVLRARYLHPLHDPLIPEWMKAQARAEPQLLYMWSVEFGNYGWSLVFEGLRHGIPDIRVRRPAPFREDDLTLLLKAHRLFRYSVDLLQLTQRDRLRIRQYGQYVAEERNRVMTVQLSRPSYDILAGLQEWAQRMEQSTLTSKATLDSVYEKAYGLPYSDALRLGALLLRVGALMEQEPTPIWPQHALDLEVLPKTLLSLYDSRTQLRSDFVTREWIADESVKVCCSLALWREQLTGLNSRFTVYDYLQEHSEFPFVGFRIGDRPYLVIHPMFAGVALYASMDWLMHDPLLKRAGKGKLALKRQRWIDKAEVRDLLDWKENLLDKLEFDWVRVGPFRLPEWHLEIDFVALASHRDEPILFVGEGKRRRAPFLPKQQIESLSFSQRAYARTEAKCRTLERNTAAVVNLARQVGLPLSGVKRIVPIVVTPHIHLAEEDQLFLSALDTPSTAREKVVQFLKRREAKGVYRGSQT